MDFDIASDVYFQPFRYSVRGYYYMRLGEPKDPEHVWPVPRQPQFIPETDPKGLTVYKTTRNGAICIPMCGMSPTSNPSLPLSSGSIVCPVTL